MEGGIVIFPGGNNVLDHNGNVIISFIKQRFSLKQNRAQNSRHTIFFEVS
jgi:hypothetical protein